MDNKAIYKKTIGFSFIHVLLDFSAIVAFVLFTIIGAIISDQAIGDNRLGILIGAIIGGVCAYIILHFFAYTYKAGQIAMMTEGVTTGKLPEHTIKAGKKIVKERFATVAVYYAVTNAIKGVFLEVGRGITAVGKAVGGDTGSAVGGTISSAINSIVAYLCDCCLGWVFYKKDEKATRATLEGAVIFFKHGKTLIRNLGRIFGISMISFLIIGGIFFGISFLIFQSNQGIMSEFGARIIENLAKKGTEAPSFVSDPTTLGLITSGVIGLIMWMLLHSNFVRPFVLVGVLRNFIKSGDESNVTDKDYKELDKKSNKFAKLHAEG